MNYNYHTHTYMCRHASGTPAEYIEKAIAGGIEFMGFSDHIPHIAKDGTQSSYRVPYDKAREYVSEFADLRDKYKEKIEISIGCESEYYLNELFRQVAGEEQAPVTFGFDAHTVDSVCDRGSQKRAEEIVEKYGLSYIGKPEIIRLKKR